VVTDDIELVLVPVELCVVWEEIDCVGNEEDVAVVTGVSVW
jgi:hypothetical protein